MLIACFVIAFTSIPLVYLPCEEPYRSLVYPLVAVQGIGLAIMLNTATSLISDVIGSDSENSAFVYGVYSLFDKFANGGILFYLLDNYASDSVALRYVLGYTPFICAILSLLLTFLGQRWYGHLMAKVVPSSI
jgi:MFS family permease